MTSHTQRGTTLVVGLILLSVVTLLGLAGASSAHVERVLAQNEQFRENAASAASAGIETAISRIVNLPEPSATPSIDRAFLSGSVDRFETVSRFLGYDRALPQAAGAHLAGAHYEITSTGFSTRRAVDRQRAHIMIIVDATGTSAAAACAPLIPILCRERGELLQLSWQRLPSE
jgi:hypothetical protein